MIFSPGPVQDHARQHCISLGSPQHLFTRTCTTSCKDPWKNSTRISTRFSHKESQMILISQDRQKKPADCGEDLTRSWYKKLRRTSQRTIQRSFHTRTPEKQGIFQIFMQGPLREDFTRISTRSAYRDLRKIIHGPLGAFQKDLHKIFS